MNSKFFLALLLTITFFSCEDQSIDNIPKCIENRLSDYEPACTEGATVDEYTFQQQLVYLFDDSECCCDFASYVLSSTCDTLGFLGGIAGFTHINGEDFANAAFVRTVWP